MKAAQERPDSRAGMDEGRSSALRKEVNSRKSVNGMALANANPNLPRRSCRSWVMGGEGGGNAKCPGGDCNCRQSETSIDWRMPVVAEYERGKRDEGEGEECST